MKNEIQMFQTKRCIVSVIQTYIIKQREEKEGFIILFKNTINSDFSNESKCATVNLP